MSKFNIDVAALGNSGACDNSRAIDTHIVNIKKKLKVLNPAFTNLIKNERGEGWIFNQNE